MSNRLVPVTVGVALLLSACSSSDQADPSSDHVERSGLSRDQAEMMLEGYVAAYGLDTGDPFCDLEGVVQAMDSDYSTATDDVNAAIGALNQAPFDEDTLVAVREAGSTLWELAVVRVLLIEQIAPLIDDAAAKEAMAFVGDMNHDLSLAMGEMLAEATSRHDLTVSLTGLLESPEVLEYFEGQSDALSVLDNYRDHRCG